MVSTKSYNDLITHVYGPYKDTVLLKDTFPPDNTMVVLDDLELYCDNKDVGFDDTEFIGNPPEGSIGAKNKEATFFGIFEIPSLDCLSERGREYLDHDLQQQDRKIHMEKFWANLKLRDIYARDRRIRVRIACRKSLSANFLTSDTDPEKLLLFSMHEGKRRRFWIKSLNVRTMELSLNFLDRYRLRALIQELIATDPDHTPVEERNIDWLIQRYLKEIHPRDCENRIIGIHIGSYESNADRAEILKIVHQVEEETKDTGRHLAHLPKARIRHYFAAHAEWLLAHMLASTSKSVKLVDIKQWIKFCRQARADSAEAQENGVQWWGVPHGGHKNQDDPSNLSRSLAMFGDTEKAWAKRLERVQRRKAVSKKQPARTPSPDPLVTEIPSPHARQFQYDSDFSEPSTPGASDTEPETDDIPRVPDFCMESPTIAEGRFIWNCPGCGHSIDLLNLSPENRRILPQDAIQVLDSKLWKVSEEPIQRAFFMMVSSHYELHLSVRNIQVFQTAGNRFLAKSLRTPVGKVAQQPSAVIKKEGSSIVLEEPRRSSRKPVKPRRMEY